MHVKTKTITILNTTSSDTSIVANEKVPENIVKKQLDTCKALNRKYYVSQVQILWSIIFSYGRAEQ